MQDIIDNAIAAGRFSRNTILYWVDWLQGFDAVPPDHIALLDFITEQENDIGESLNEIIPHDWRKD